MAYSLSARHWLVWTAAVNARGNTHSPYGHEYKHSPYGHDYTHSPYGHDYTHSPYGHVAHSSCATLSS